MFRVEYRIELDKCIISNYQAIENYDHHKSSYTMYRTEVIEWLINNAICRGGLQFLPRGCCKSPGSASPSPRLASVQKHRLCRLSIPELLPNFHERAISSSASPVPFAPTLRVASCQINTWSYRNNFLMPPAVSC